MIKCNAITDRNTVYQRDKLMDGFDGQRDVHLKKPERHCTEGEVQLVDG